MTELAVIGLAAWRVASLLVNEDGPFYIFDKLRRWAGVYRTGERGFGALVLSCMWCAGLWTALAAYLVWLVAPAVDYVLAAAAVVILADALSSRREST